MNAAEYHLMAAVEREHWWYCGLRDLVARCLPEVTARRPLRVLDAGCGTGENLCLLRDRLAPDYLGGFDISPTAVEYARAKCPQADIHVGDICRPERLVTDLDVVLCCDVLYVPGASAALDGLRRLVQALRSGGRFILNLPAYAWLRSRHDVAIHTSQRFTAPEVRELLTEIGLSVEVLTYRMCLLFPLVLMARLPGMLWPPAASESVRSDVVLPHPWINTALRRLLCAENARIERGLRLPWGSSVFAVGRKP